MSEERRRLNPEWVAEKLNSIEALLKKTISLLEGNEKQERGAVVFRKTDTDESSTIPKLELENNRRAMAEIEEISKRMTPADRKNILSKIKNGFQFAGECE